jgi:hypothetical protein
VGAAWVNAAGRAAEADADEGLRPRPDSPAGGLVLHGRMMIEAGLGSSAPRVALAALAVLGAASLSCVSVHGEIRSHGPPLGDYDFVADKCEQVWESEAGSGQWVAVDKAGRRVAIGVFPPAFRSDQSVTIARMDDLRQISLKENGLEARCRVFDAGETMSQEATDFSGHVTVDCDTSQGGHVTASLVFRHCAGAW